ncbi:hypothetical protein T07_5849 [Trichinella nelsoni]|uniref:Uncharacterized protein n=1 Tax=Trichinella nelsoni TaxID=6336 RepID=A0A0V0RLG4_9BILA|nr:hypothetical protein T07_5849 [Trichinella nelsoni]
MIQSTYFGHSCLKTSPSSPTTTATSNRTRTLSISKRGARSELPSTPDFITPSTSGGSGKQRVLDGGIARPRSSPKNGGTSHCTGSFPNCPGGGLPLGCVKLFTAVRAYGQFAHESLTGHFVRVHKYQSQQWQYWCRKCNTEFLPTGDRYPFRVLDTHVRSSVRRWKITRKMGESEDLHGVQCDVCDYVGVSKRAVGMHSLRHANKNIMQITGKAVQIEALSKQVRYINVVARDYRQFKFRKRVRQYLLVDDEIRKADEKEVPAEPRTILGESSTATAIEAVGIYACGPVRADTAAQQMICRIGQ